MLTAKQRINVDVVNHSMFDLYVFLPAFSFPFTGASNGVYYDYQRRPHTRGLKYSLLFPIPRSYGFTYLPLKYPPERRAPLNGTVHRISPLRILIPSIITNLDKPIHFGVGN